MARVAVRRCGKKTYLARARYLDTLSISSMEDIIVNLKSKSKFWSLTASAIGVLGVSGLAVLGGVKAAEAATVLAGKDYLQTPGGGASFFFDFSAFGGSGLTGVSFTGLPIDLANLSTTDTIAERLDDVIAPVANSLDAPPVNAAPSDSITRLQIVDLSLRSSSAVNIAGSSYDIFVGLDPNVASTGAMAIAHSPGIDSPGGIWSSSFDINGIAIVAAQGVLDPGNTPNFIKNLISGCPTATTYQCVSFSKGTFVATNQLWSHTGGFQGPDSSNFYLTGQVIHDAGGGIIHKVDPVPEPITILGSGAALGFGAFFKKRSRKSKKQALA